MPEGMAEKIWDTFVIMFWVYVAFAIVAYYFETRNKP